MIELADVFRRFAADDLNAHGATMPPSHRRAIEDILDCRTAALGGQVWRCDACGAETFSFHSCGNRSCPKCHTAQTEEWRGQRQAEMLPVPYFHITVTVPAELPAVLRAHQSDGYAVLMQATAAAIIERAGDPRFVGGTVGVRAVLHTWDQQLNLPPHVHCLVSGGGISDDGTTWPPARRNFLLPIKALARKVRGKVRALLQRRCPGLTVPDVVWHKPWIAHVTAWGRGEQTVRDDLARYVFRIAITNARIVGLDDAGVTFASRDRKTGQRRTCRLSGDAFMRRFLQHVLPRGFHKVRYFGLWHPAHREDAARVRQMLQLQAPPPAGPLPESAVPPDPAEAAVAPAIEPRICPHCHQGRLIFIRSLTRGRPWDRNPDNAPICHRPVRPRVLRHATGRRCPLRRR
jgi:hypothetical protein